MHFHLTLSAFVTICLGTNMADSNRRQDKSHVGENQELVLFPVSIFLSLPTGQGNAFVSRRVHPYFRYHFS